MRWEWTRVRAVLVTTLLFAGSLMMVTATGCGDSGGDEKSSARTEASSEGGAAEEGGAEESGGEVPASLGALESGAEDAIDLAHGGDRKGVVGKAHAILRAARGQAAADLRDAGVAAAQISELQQRARLLARLAARAPLVRVSLAANGISGLMPQFYARYRDPVPPEVLELDYLDREAQLRSLAGDRESVPAAVGDLSATWTGLRPKVIDAGGRAVALRYSRHVRSMQQLAVGSHARALQRQAVTGLQLVDELEGQFRSH